MIIKIIFKNNDKEFSINDGEVIENGTEFENISEAKRYIKKAKAINNTAIIETF